MDNSGESEAANSTIATTSFSKQDPERAETPQDVTAAVIASRVQPPPAAIVVASAEVEADKSDKSEDGGNADPEEKANFVGDAPTANTVHVKTVESRPPSSVSKSEGAAPTGDGKAAESRPSSSVSKKSQFSSDKVENRPSSSSKQSQEHSRVSTPVTATAQTPIE